MLNKGAAITGILEGIRVLDIGLVVAIPSAGAMMADWRTDVIKVEPLEGEMFRGMTKTEGVDRVIKYKGGEVEWVIQLLNRNKRSLAIDLKKDAGRDIFYQLVQRSDVFMSNYAVGALVRLKLDYTTLSRFNPGLVYDVLTGYGLVGPDKDERSYDYSASWARSGMQYLIGELGSAPPP